VDFNLTFSDLTELLVWLGKNGGSDERLDAFSRLYFCNLSTPKRDLESAIEAAHELPHLPVRIQTMLASISTSIRSTRSQQGEGVSSRALPIRGRTAE